MANNIISVNSNYIRNRKKLSSWNVWAKKKAYNTQNGYSFGFDWKNAKTLRIDTTTQFHQVQWYRIERSHKNYILVILKKIFMSCGLITFETTARE
jgi:hypothetical protein